jgi:integrase
MGQLVIRLAATEGQTKMTNIIRKIHGLETFETKGIRYAFFKQRPTRKNGLLKTVRTPLPTPIFTPEFWAAYHQAARGEAVTPVAARAHGGSLQMAVAQYLESENFFGRVQSPAARARQASTLRKWCREDGEKPLALFNRAAVDRMLGAIDSLNAKYTMLITVRQFCKWAVSKQLMPGPEPTKDIEDIRAPQSDGHDTWSEEQIAQFEQHWQLGTLERLMFDLLLYTGQRGSDVRRLSAQHIKDGEFNFKQQKTGVEVCCPVHPALAASLSAGPGGLDSSDLSAPFLTWKDKPLPQGKYNELFRAACRSASLPDACVPHGLRKAFCCRLADLGVSTHDIAALSGHLSLREVERYTKKYNRRTGGRRAMATLIASGGA